LLTGEASVAAVVQATGWDEADVTALAGPGGFAFVQADFHEVEKLLRLASCVALAHSSCPSGPKQVSVTFSPRFLPRIG
jgi:hypothetical protein